MKYQPVKVHQIFEVQYEPATKPWHQFAVGVQTPSGGTVPGSYQKNGKVMVATGRTKSYWTVTCNLFGECGHKHRTESGAQTCAVRVKKRWKAHRSKQAKASWVSRMSNQRLEGIGAVLVD